MKFNTYNSINAPHTPGRFQGAATVNMTVNGAITLSSKCATLLGAGDGDRVVFLQDADYPSDWYIQKTTSKDGFVLRKDGRNALAFKSSTIVELVGKSALKTMSFSSVLFQTDFTENGVRLDVKHPKVNAPRVGKKR